VTFRREEEMYPLVVEWLRDYLSFRHKNSKLLVLDGSKKSLSRIIADNGLTEFVPQEWVSWDIHVDVVGFTSGKMKTDLALVECKLDPLTLRDLSQLIGYYRVAKPKYAFLISPRGISDSLTSLLKTYSRVDILRYHQETGRLAFSIVLASWSEERMSLDWSTAIADDSNIIGNI
jgi:hypothetical protein